MASTLLKSISGVAAICALLRSAAASPATRRVVGQALLEDGDIVGMTTGLEASG